MNLHDIESLTQSKSNLDWAKENYETLDSLVYLGVDDTRNGVDMYATFSSFGKLSTCGIRIVDEEVHSTTCGCKYHERDSVCGHVIVALYLYLDYGPFDGSFNYDNFIKNKDKYQKESSTKSVKTDSYYDKMKQSGASLIDSFKTINQSGILKELGTKQYKLEYELTYEQEYEYTYHSGYIEKDYYRLGLKIGDDRMYVVKNIRDFFEDISQENTVKYGKYLNLAHHEDAFDDMTRATFDDLRKLMGNRTTTRYINIHDESFDTLFEMLSKVSPDRTNLELKTELIESNLIIDKLDDDTYMINNDDELAYIMSKEYFYSVSAQDFVQYKTLNPQIQKVMTHIFNEGFMVVDKKALDLLEVYLRDDLSVKRNYEEHKPALVNISLFLDVEDDLLVSKMVLEVESIGKVDGFSEESIQYYDQDAIMVRDTMLALGELSKENQIEMSLYEDKTFDFLDKGLIYLHQYCDVFASDSLKNVNRPTNLKLQVGISINNNLLDVDIESMNVSNKDLAELLTMYRRKKSFHRLSSGEVINLASKDMEELDNLVQTLQLKPKDLEEVQTLPLFRSFQLEGNTENYEAITAHLDQTVMHFNDQFKEHKIDEVKINEKFEPILKDYQRYGVKWLSLLETYGFNGILADDMGLGKTIQIIALLENKKHDKPSIVVCPASLLFNWEDELKKFNSGLNHICIYGPKDKRAEDIKTLSKYDLVITTYDYLKSDIELYDAIEFDTVVIDEAQYIKNHNTLAARSVKKLKSQNRVALSGTPIENRLSELWSIFDFLMPGYLYTYTAFRSNYERPIVIDQDEDAQVRLRNLIEPFILRRTKQEVLKDLPGKTEKIISFNFSEEENDLYLAKLAQGNEAVSEILGMDNPNKLSILKILGELRQMCCDPRLLYDNITNISSKMKGCLEIVDSIVENDEKVLIFSSFTSILDLIEVELQNRNIKYHMLTGSTNKEKRKERVASFQEDDSKVFLMSLKAAGVGLNLTSAQNVIHFDPWWNVSAENQATDRTHRIGQTSDVQVYKLIMKDSIEEKILKMQEHKKNLSDMFIEGSTGSFSSLSKDEILDLFK